MSDLFVRMWPHMKELQSFSSGIAQVIKHYFKYLPDCGIQLVDPGATSYDLTVSHAGAGPDGEHDWYPDVYHSHGMLWTAEFDLGQYAWQTNRVLVRATMGAREVTVPSEWVSRVFKRDFRINPHVIGHGIEWDEWQHEIETENWALWGKNRRSDGLNPMSISQLARAFPETKFLSTFTEPGMPGNVVSLGNHALPWEEMKMLIQASAVYLATDRETWGIGMAEAMAAGVPVLSVDSGAVPTFMPHGEAGYCFRPGDIDDAIRGMEYCLRYRDTLSANAREIAKGFHWPTIVEEVAGIYRLALREEKPTVDVVIPCYNYSEVLDGAIDSIRRQTFRAILRIIVIDDGSPDGDRIKMVVERHRSRDDRVELVRLPVNQGVAGARNEGFLRSNAKYIVPLDSDDRIEPGFIERLVPIMEADRTLGIAYTGVRVTQEDLPDTLPWDWRTTVDPGEEIRGRQWPHEWDFDAQVGRENQIPTCCLIRKKAFDRVGGYRSRYCPDGAGSEDAELFLRLGAYGWGAKYIKPKRDALWIHDHGQGIVSSQSAYEEPDWTAWHPWTRDQLHPVASHATPIDGLLSHPVRSYEKPLVSVIIPVGPGHEEKLVDALDSLEAQTYRNWEAIVVLDGTEMTPTLINAYPYARVFSTIQQGPGAARNLGVKQAQAPFIAFLDADDYLLPDYLDKCIEGFDITKSIIYTDFISRLTRELHAKYTGVPIKTFKRTGEVLVADRFADFNQELAMQRPKGERPYVWSPVTVFLPKKWHSDIGGFDETLETWEDCDYLLRLAWAGYDFFRIAEPLWQYNFSSGMRREKIVGQEGSLIAYLQEKWDRRFSKQVEMTDGLQLQR